MIILKNGPTSASFFLSFSNNYLKNVYLLTGFELETIVD